VLVAALTACSLTPAKYDPVEQMGYAALWQKAKRLEQACDRARRSPELERAIVAEMYDTGMLFGAYLFYQTDPAPKQIWLAFAHLQDRVGAVADGSAAYCKESAINLQDAAIRALKTNAGRER